MRPAAALWVFALVLAAACGSESSPLAPPTVRLQLAPADPDFRPEPGAHVVRTLAVPEGLAPWSVNAGGAQVVPRKMNGPEQPVTRAVHLPRVRRGPLRVTLPGRYEPGSFHQIAVRLLGGGSAELRAVLARGGQPAVASRTLFVPGRREAVRVVLDVPQMRSRRNELDELRIELDDVTGNWFLGDVDLLAKPLRHWLPRVERGAGLIDIQSEARRGVGLSSQVPLACELDAPAEGGRLAFSLGWPLAVRDRSEHGSVHAILGQDRRELLREVIPLGRGTAPRPWNEHWIDLVPFAGRHLWLRFELESGTGEEMLVALSEPHVVSPRDNPITVLLVTSDTHRADHLGASGAVAGLRTPALDALAARGLLFTNCFSSANVTIPSHVALMTGTHPRDTGILSNQSELAQAAPTLAEVFRDAGWLTLAVTSNRTLGRPQMGLGQGFDRTSWPDEAFREGQRSVDVLERWLPEAEGRPLFCWLHLFDAHTPYLPPPPYDTLCWPQGRDAKDPALPDPHFPVPRYWAGVRDPDWIRAQYAGEIGYLDAQLARILNHPRIRTGIVAVTADHGESLGQHGIWWDHNGLYPDTVHVPLILSWPALESPGRIDDPVRQVDVGRTLLELAGVESDFPGRDLTAQIDPEEPRFALASGGTMASVARGPWYLLLGLDDRTDRLPWKDPGFEYGEVRLFDLAHDPGCRHDLVEAEPERAREMRALLIAWLDGAQPTDWEAGRGGVRDESMLEDLARLGYAPGTEREAPHRLYDPERAGAWAERFE